MKIKSLKIENFRQYKGPITIEFSQDPDRNFTIIEGTNGTGKTTLLNAITWCLYGEEMHKEDDSPIYNNITGKEMESNKTMKVNVELEIINEKERNVVISRKIEFYKKNNGDIMPSGFGDEFSVIMNINGEDKSLDNPDLYIGKNLPLNIENYFFFDGEKLEEYFDENSGNTIKESVLELSQLNLFEKMNKNLSNRETDFNNELKKLNKTAGNVSSKISECKAQINELKDEKREANHKKEESSKKIKGYRAKLSKLDKENVKELEENMQDCEKGIEKIEKGEEKEKNEKRNNIIKSFPLLLSYENFSIVEELGSTLKEKKYIPPKFKREFIDDILKDGKCICGTKLVEGSEHYENILKLKEETPKITNISNEISILLNDIKGMKKESQDFFDKNAKQNEILREYEEGRKELTDKLTNIKFKLKNIDDETIKMLNKGIADYENIKENAISKISRCETEIENNERKLKKLEKEMKQYELNNKKAKEISEQIDFTRKAKKFSDILSNDISESIRKKIEKKTADQFKKLMWKENFNKVSIDENYNITIHSSDGDENNPSRLSAGEQLVLALSFVSALHSISGFDLPLIIDTPMGRLGTEMKSNISKTLPKFLEKKQIVLLVTNEEYTNEFKDGISDNIGKEYQLKVNEFDNGSETIVRSIYEY